MALFDDWYDYINPLEYIDYAFGNGDSVGKAEETLDNSKKYWEANKTDNQNELDSYLAAVGTNQKDNEKLLKDTYGSSMGKYDELMKKYEDMGAYNAGQFNYGKDINEFLSPAMAMRQKAAADAITKSQANAGSMFSSDYLDALNAKAQAIASEEYDKAYDRLYKDRSQYLSEWQAQNAENKAAYDSQSNLYNNLINKYGTDRTSYVTGLVNNNNSYLNQLGDYYSQNINNNNAYTQGMTNLDVSKANAEVAHDNGLTNFLNFGLNAFNSFAAG